MRKSAELSLHITYLRSPSAGDDHPRPVNGMGHESHPSRVPSPSGASVGLGGSRLAVHRGCWCRPLRDNRLIVVARGHQVSLTGAPSYGTQRLRCVSGSRRRLFARLREQALALAPARYPSLAEGILKPAQLERE